MIEERRYLHASVSTGNKMFVIGGYIFTEIEVFDNHSRKFTSIKSFSTLPSTKYSYFQAVCIGSNVIVFHMIRDLAETKIYMYDVDKEIWSNVDCDFIKNLYGSSCVKYYTH